METQRLPVVLIIESDPVWKDLFTDLLEGRAEVLFATTLEEGERIFRSRDDLFAIAIGSFTTAAVNEPPSINLVRTIRRAFGGYLIGMSVDVNFRKAFGDAHCNRVCEKVEIGAVLEDLLTLHV